MTGTPRVYHHAMVHFLRADITFASPGSGVAKTIGTLPAGAVVHKTFSGVNVSTLFNDSGTDLLDIGVTGTADLFATDLSLAAVGWQPCDEAVSFYAAAAIDVTATYTGQNADATTGVAQIIIGYVPNNGNNAA